MVCGDRWLSPTRRANSWRGSGGGARQYLEVLDWSTILLYGWKEESPAEAYALGSDAKERSSRGHTHIAALHLNSAMESRGRTLYRGSAWPEGSPSLLEECLEGKLRSASQQLGSAALRRVQIRPSNHERASILNKYRSYGAESGTIPTVNTGICVHSTRSNGFAW